MLEWLNAEVAARLSGGDVMIGGTDIHVMAHKAGVQASIEKTMLVMAGAMRGVRFFHTVGSLGMDEVFSPVQLLLDLEMLEGVQRILRGMLINEYEGEYVWYPRLFTRKSFNALMNERITDAAEKARALAYEQMGLPPV